MIRFFVSESGCLVAYKALKNKLTRSNNSMSDWETSVIHVTGVVIFKPYKYGEGE